MARISVIVPIFNAENYLNFCLDSLLLQNFKDYEIICINDGSTDDTINILDCYSKFDNKIKIITQENKGYGGAKNKGLENATGEYITFVDSDDIVSPLMLKNLYENIKYTKSDFVFSNIININNNTMQISKVDFGIESKVFKETANQTSNCSANEIFACISGTACAKLYRRNFIENMKFDENIAYENIPFITNCFLNANRVSFDKNTYYVYNNENKLPPCDIIRMRDKQAEIFKTANKYDNFKELLFKFKIADILNSILYKSDLDKVYMLSVLKIIIANTNFDIYNRSKINKIKKICEKILLMNDFDFIKYINHLRQRGEYV